MEDVMRNIKPIESEDYPGYFKIPDYTRYVLSKDGVVFDKLKKKKLHGSKNPAGYVNFYLYGDDGVKLTWGRHRLLAYVFKPTDSDYRQLITNHINGVKGSDHLDNLEWSTYVENIEHAGKLGLTTKCCPISVRDVDTGVIIKYPSIIKCARAMNMSKDSIIHRCIIGERRIFPERKQYRKSHDNDKWFIPKDIDKAIKENGTSKSILVRNIFTGIIEEFEQMQHLARYLGVVPSVITVWVNDTEQPVLRWGIQIKWSSDTSPWRKILDPDKELFFAIGGKSCKPVERICGTTGVIKRFHSANECARHSDITTASINYRLKSNGKRIFQDGYRYRYLEV